MYFFLNGWGYLIGSGRLIGHLHRMGWDGVGLHDTIFIYI